MSSAPEQKSPAPHETSHRFSLSHFVFHSVLALTPLKAIDEYYDSLLADPDATTSLDTRTNRVRVYRAALFQHSLLTVLIGCVIGGAGTLIALYLVSILVTSRGPAPCNLLCHAICDEQIQADEQRPTSPVTESVPNDLALP